MTKSKTSIKNAAAPSIEREVILNAPTAAPAAVETAAVPDGTARVTPAVWERVAAEAQGILSEMRLTSMLGNRSLGGLCPLFFCDNVVHAALPWADVDVFQRRLLSTRAPDDELLLTQLLDLVPSLAGRSLVDVGSFTGSTAFFLAALMKPAVTHLFEPQAIMQEALGTAVERNGAICGPLVLHRIILDEEGAEMTVGRTTPARLSHTSYLRREGGPLRARALDSLDLGTVGLINLDYLNQKVPMLRGAMATIQRDRPMIVTDLSARDVAEVRDLIVPLDYQELRIGRNSMILLPN